MDAKISGSLGEAFAEEILCKNGYRLLSRNYHSRYGEIDRILENGTYLVFLEVKLRKKSSIYLPREAVTESKQEKLRKTASCYLAEHPTHLQPRFDVFEINDYRENPFCVKAYTILENAF